VLKIGNRGAILSGVARFCNQNEGLVLPLKSWYDFWWRGAILQNRGAILDAENISYLS
jgi:hypothetical protein